MSRRRRPREGLRQPRQSHRAARQSDARRGGRCERLVSWQPPRRERASGRGLVWAQTSGADRALPAREAVQAPHRARDRRRCSRATAVVARAAAPRRRSRSTRSSSGDTRRRSAGSSARSSSPASLGIACSYAQTYFTGWTGERMLADLRNHLFRHLQRLSLGFYERNRAGVAHQPAHERRRGARPARHRRRHARSSRTRSCSSARRSILFLLDWRLALAMLTVIPLLIDRDRDLPQALGRAVPRASARRSALVTATLAEDIAGMRVVQAFTRERAAQRALPRGQRALPRARTRRPSS